jgi:hypothetical protein
MLKRILSKLLFGIFAAVVLIVIFQSSNPVPSFLTNDAVVKEVNLLIEQKQFDAAISLIEQELSSTKSLEEPRKCVWLLERQADVHEYAYHFHYAIDSLKRANKIKYKKHNQDRIEHWQDYINRHQKERHLKDSYHSGLSNGMSAELSGQVNIAYVYIEDRQNNKWTGKRRLENQASIDRVLDWYKREAKKYGKPAPTFKVRYFVIQSPRGVEKSWLRKTSTFSYLTELLLKHTKYTHFDQFLRFMQGGNNQENVALIFHSNFQNRSYASRCHSKDIARHCKYEYVMLTEDIANKKFSWVIPQVQAHEILHLFGAADLYNIKQAKDYAVTDVMNYYSSDLTYSTIEPITAWAIGWQTKPHAPFRAE